MTCMIRTPRPCPISAGGAWHGRRGPCAPKVLTPPATWSASTRRKPRGAPHHIVLTVDSQVVKPDGTQFNITANGTDCATILAQVVDSNGVLCPTDSHIVTFSVSGPCQYRGGTDAFVTAASPSGIMRRSTRTFRSKAACARWRCGPRSQPGP